jgi:NAD(P)-dependent dehydrogenase (short-subunit alcohol dehydrogenase family)
MMPIKGKAFDGKVALITASSTGIGLAIAKRLSSEGCKVIISSRKKLRRLEGRLMVLYVTWVAKNNG